MNNVKVILISVFPYSLVLMSRLWFYLSCTRVFYHLLNLRIFVCWSLSLELEGADQARNSNKRAGQGLGALLLPVNKNVEPNRHWLCQGLYVGVIHSQLFYVIIYDLPKGEQLTSSVPWGHFNAINYFILKIFECVILHRHVNFHFLLLGRKGDVREILPWCTIRQMST